MPRSGGHDFRPSLIKELRSRRPPIENSPSRRTSPSPPKLEPPTKRRLRCPPTSSTHKRRISVSERRTKDRIPKSRSTPNRPIAKSHLTAGRATNPPSSPFLTIPRLLDHSRNPGRSDSRSSPLDSASSQCCSGSCRRGLTSLLDSLR